MIYGYAVKRGGDQQEAADLAREGKCPTCRGAMRDLRGKVTDGSFDAMNFEREGACFRWANDAYTCAAYMRRK